MVNAPLHIITLVKWVPDSQLERRYNADGRIDRSEGVLSELDEYPLEAALQIKEAAPDREIRVTALTMGPAGSSSAAKKALQIGADDAYQLTDDALVGADIWATSVALKAAVEAVTGAAEFESGEPEYLVLTGMASDEGESGAIPAQLAERLGAHAVTYATSLTLEAERMVVTRSGGTEAQKVAVGFPAVVSVTDQANDPRYPNFKAIMAAKKKTLTRFTLSEVGLRPEQVNAKVRLVEAQVRPPRTAGEVITDEGDAGIKIVEFLAKERLL